MKIRVISDLHIDVNEKFPFSFRTDSEKETFALIAGDVSGNVKLTARWIKDNVRNGAFVAGNHDPCYNDSGKTILEQKKFLADRYPQEGFVSFLDESVGVMSKEVPGTNTLVVGTTLYTDYRYSRSSDSKMPMEEINMDRAHRGLNDFRFGHVTDEIEPLRQRHVRASDYRKWFDASIGKIAELVESNQDRDIIVLTHHAPSPKCISDRYVADGMNASYVSDLEGFITSHPNIRAWCCGHVHNVTVDRIGNALLVCNPRGYERNLESLDWNPNTFIDTDTWEVTVEPFEPAKKLMDARRKANEDFMKYACLFV